MLERTYGRRTSQEQRALIERMGSIMGSHAPRRERIAA
jgi:hypothetical protein